MTGYGKQTQVIDKTTITVEIRSVNHRFLDVNTRIPNSFLSQEDKIKKIVESFFNRGRIDVFIRLQGEGYIDKTLRTDWQMMDQYIHEMKEAKKRYQLQGEIPATILTTLPDVFSIQEVEKQSNDLQENMLVSVEKACEQALSMRIEEGAFLLQDIKTRIDELFEMITMLNTRRDVVREEYRERIRQRLTEYLHDTIKLDEARLHQEIALLVEKGDITEEITRLFSHIEHMKELIKGNKPVGRKLDFIIQEMHRETNTIGSKSIDVKISEWTVTLKSNIEKLKEQIQNIE